jgi:hypothetical protein
VIEGGPRGTHLIPCLRQSMAAIGPKPILPAVSMKWSIEYCLSAIDTVIFEISFTSNLSLFMSQNTTTALVQIRLSFRQQA